MSRPRLAVIALPLAAAAAAVGGEALCPGRPWLDLARAARAAEIASARAALRGERLRFFGPGVRPAYLAAKARLGEAVRAARDPERTAERRRAFEALAAAERLERGAAARLRDAIDASSAEAAATALEAAQRGAAAARDRTLAAALEVRRAEAEAEAFERPVLAAEDRLIASREQRPPDPLRLPLPGGRLELCPTCHRFGGAPVRPPHPGELLRTHPPLRFGCTACHGGAARWLGHGPDHGTPLARGAALRRRCAGCHGGAPREP